MLAVPLPTCWVQHSQYPTASPLSSPLLIVIRLTLISSLLNAHLELSEQCHSFAVYGTVTGVYHRWLIVLVQLPIQHQGGIINPCYVYLIVKDDVI